jgi:RHS repeat-associated protein
VWRWDQQEPFGNNPADENPSALGVFDLPLRLPGQYFDRETTLHYNAARDYDPSLGRYGESDPIGLRGGLNTYSYVGGNPLSFTDPLGQASLGDVLRRILGPIGSEAGTGADVGGALGGGAKERQWSDIGKKICATGVNNQGIWSNCTDECVMGSPKDGRPAAGSDDIVDCTNACTRAYEECVKKKPRSSCPPPNFI